MKSVVLRTINTQQSHVRQMVLNLAGVWGRGKKKGRGGRGKSARGWVCIWPNIRWSKDSVRFEDLPVPQVQAVQDEDRGKEEKGGKKKGRREKDGVYLHPCLFMLPGSLGGKKKEKKRERGEEKKREKASFG